MTFKIKINPSGKCKIESSPGDAWKATRPETIIAIMCASLTGKCLLALSKYFVDSFEAVRQVEKMESAVLKDRCYQEKAFLKGSPNEGEVVDGKGTVLQPGTYPYILLRNRRLSQCYMAMMGRKKAFKFIRENERDPVQFNAALKIWKLENGMNIEERWNTTLKTLRDTTRHRLDMWAYIRLFFRLKHRTMQRWLHFLKR